MNAPDSQVLSRVSKMLLAGIGVAFAWLLLTFALGISSSNAHADDDSGLIDGLGSALVGATSSVTDIVEDTAASVADAVAPVVQSVVSTPPVQPVAPVIEIVAPVVTTVVSSVADVAASGVTSPIVDVANEAVAAIPLVGATSAALGLDDTLASVGASVDTILTGTTAAAADTATGVLDTATGVPDTATGVLDPLTGLLPGVPPLGPTDDVLTPSVAAASADAAPQPLEAVARAAMLSVATSWAAVTNAAMSGAPIDTSVTAPAGLGALTFLRTVLQADSVFMGPGGAGLGAWVLVALGLVVAYRAWMRRSGLENDVAPAAPVLSTDVSPD